MVLLEIDPQALGLTGDLTILEALAAVLAAYFAGTAWSAGVHAAGRAGSAELAGFLTALGAAIGAVLTLADGAGEGAGAPPLALAAAIALAALATAAAAYDLRVLAGGGLRRAERALRRDWRAAAAAGCALASVGFADPRLAEAASRHPALSLAGLIALVATTLVWRVRLRLGRGAGRAGPLRPAASPRP